MMISVFGANMTYAVQVVLLVDLLLDSSVDSESDDVGITLAAGIRNAGIFQCILQLLHLLSRDVLLFLHRVLEVTAQTLNLLDLLAEITAQAGQCADDVILNVPRFVGLGDGALVVVFEDTRRLAETVPVHEDCWVAQIRKRVLHLVKGFGAHLVGGLNLTKVRDEAFEQLTPCLEAVCQGLRGRAVGGNRCVECAIEVAAVVAANASDAARSETFAATAALQATSSAHTRAFLECVVSRNAAGRRRCGRGRALHIAVGVSASTSELPIPVRRVRDWRVAGKVGCADAVATVELSVAGLRHGAHRS
jgi:hypothetical protein